LKKKGVYIVSTNLSEGVYFKITIKNTKSGHLPRRKVRALWRQKKTILGNFNPKHSLKFSKSNQTSTLERYLAKTEGGSNVHKLAIENRRKSDYLLLYSEINGRHISKTFSSYNPNWGKRAQKSNPSST